MISCRRYWKGHYAYLEKRIRKLGGRCRAPWIFKHEINEPWSTIGVFLTIAGKNPRHYPWLRKHYPKYGHTKRQLVEVEHDAMGLAENLRG